MLRHILARSLVSLVMGSCTLALLLAGCGGGSGAVAPSASADTPAAPPFVQASKSSAVGAAGGSVSLTAADGTVFKFEMPAGALSATTTLTLATQKPAAGQQFNLLLQPAGLVLSGGGAGTLTVALPVGQSLPAAGGMAYGGILIPFTRLADGRLQVSLTAFASAVLSAPTSTRLAIAAASTSVCGSAPNLQSSGGLTAVTAVDIDLYGQCMVSAVQELAVTGEFAQAVRVALSVAAYLQATGAGNATQLTTQASSIACTAYALALDRARTTSVTAMGTLYALVKPIMFWERTAQQLGATCAGIGAGDYQSVIHTKTGEAVAYYAQQKPAITDTSSSAYTQAKAEAVQSVKASNEVLALSPAPTLRSTVIAEVVQRAQPGVVDALLQAPWLRCRNSGNYDELMSLLDALGSPDSIKSAAQYCATQLGVEVLDNQNRSTATLNGLGGVAAGQNQTTGSVQASADGVLRLTGPIGSLRCPAGVASSEELVIRFAGVEVRRLGVAPYLASNISLNISDLRTAASLASSNTTPQPLTITRTGEACSAYWGAAPAPLLALTLNFGSDTQIAYAGSDGSFHVMKPDGTSLALGLSSSFNVFTFAPRLSPDGRRVAGSVRDASGIDSIKIMNIDGTGIINVPTALETTDYSPQWSRDGNKIGFTRDSILNYANAMMFDVNTLALTSLTQNVPRTEVWSRNVDISPDGQSAVFEQQGHSQAVALENTLRMNANGSDLVTGGLNQFPRWSPDGLRIAFIRSTYSSQGLTEPSKLMIVSAAGGGGQGIETGCAGFIAGVDWSPDGQSLVYSCYIPQGNSGVIKTIKLNGTGGATIGSGIYPTWVRR